MSENSVFRNQRFREEEDQFLNQDILVLSEKEGRKCIRRKRKIRKEGGKEWHTD